MMLGLGAINLERFIPELAAVELWPMPYLAFIGIDVAGGLLAIAGGIGLMKPRRWGWTLSLAAWGAMLTNSAFMCWSVSQGI
jgi:hypothetical protein